MHSIIYITTKNRQEADKIVDTLLGEKLIACANVFPVASKFWWKGRIERCSETAVICKTKSKLASAVIKRSKQLHSYDVPDAIEISIRSGNKNFLRWIDDSTR
ncbi:MAG: divalent-cation tolerance protein CutA [Candidatus Aenigmarchaeota archaeon]|nr:divalent-cation tolerance protein CutA [Candidatus Aenigmarchaeota archaeon]